MENWMIWLMDGAILAIIGFFILVFMFIKRGRYAKQAQRMIRAEIILPTGWSEFHTIPCDIGAKSVTIGDFIYMMVPNERRYGQHPRVPFMGFTFMQVPIRIETWYKDNPEPVRLKYDKPVATSAEIKAMTREIQATQAAMEIQEIDARQKELTAAISNQPNKMIVYIGLAVCLIASVACVILVYQVPDAVKDIIQAGM